MSSASSCCGSLMRATFHWRSETHVHGHRPCTLMPACSGALQACLSAAAAHQQASWIGGRPPAGAHRARSSIPLAPWRHARSSHPARPLQMMGLCAMFTCPARECEQGRFHQPRAPDWPQRFWLASPAWSRAHDPGTVNRHVAAAPARGAPTRPFKWRSSTELGVATPSAPPGGHSPMPHECRAIPITGR
jgi:hypothetical protein